MIQVRKKKALYRAFLRAARRRDAAGITELIVHHPELHDYSGHEGGLVWFLGSNAPELLEAAFKAGLSPDSGDILPFLHRATAEGNREWVQLALQYGADLEKRNSDGETALGYAVAYMHLDILRMLLDAGADVNGIETPEDGSRNTPLDLCGERPEKRELAELLRSVGGKTYSELIPPKA
jgi:hypothetical protein